MNYILGVPKETCAGRMLICSAAFGSRYGAFLEAHRSYCEYFTKTIVIRLLLQGKGSVIKGQVFHKKNGCVSSKKPVQAKTERPISSTTDENV